jgi:hypothetical protein
LACARSPGLPFPAQNLAFVVKSSPAPSSSLLQYANGYFSKMGIMAMGWPSFPTTDEPTAAQFVLTTSLQGRIEFGEP